jgi:hypothetical protein
MSPETAQAILDEIAAIRRELRAWAEPKPVVRQLNLGGGIRGRAIRLGPTYPLPGSTGDVPYLGPYLTGSASSGMSYSR